MATVLELDQAAKAFHALSDPTRLQIVHLLRQGERCVCDLTEALGAAQSRLSFHLRGLKDAGLVRDRKEGRWVYYSLADDAIRSLSALLGDCCVPDRRWLRGGCCG
jgi:ArsR family transcriptional regulator